MIDKLDPYLLVAIFVLVLKQLLSPGGARSLHIALAVLWPLLRQLLGWLMILLGILGIFLPILQGIIFLVLGVALVGPRHPVIRQVSVRSKKLLRRWSGRGGLLGWMGRSGLKFVRQVREQTRKLQRWRRG